MTVNEPAGFWIRLGALLLDALIIALPLSLIILIITGGRHSEENISEILSFLYNLLTPVFWNGYTVGKRICGIRIVKVNDGASPGLGTMLLRNVVAYLVYVFTFGIAVIVSVIMVAVREDKRSLHDFIAGTMVIRD
ncbi:membrane protein [Paenibacillus swuensis]|uniref:Membrane protein n=1 Tax=Paenibacillus swuensis TaxID=1178515 RepID=A0A172TIX5_9BACL|nr:RDD family protein [Paenibacillus swuensis]ANE46988.1 membrane protein [Paenibacillus swuensis]